MERKVWSEGRRKEMVKRETNTIFGINILSALLQLFHLEANFLEQLLGLLMELFVRDGCGLLDDVDWLAFSGCWLFLVGLETLVGCAGAGKASRLQLSGQDS